MTMAWATPINSLPITKLNASQHKIMEKLVIKRIVYNTYFLSRIIEGQLITSFREFCEFLASFLSQFNHRQFLVDGVWLCGHVQLLWGTPFNEAVWINHSEKSCHILGHRLLATHFDILTLKNFFHCSQVLDVTKGKRIIARCFSFFKKEAPPWPWKQRQRVIISTLTSSFKQIFTSL